MSSAPEQAKAAEEETTQAAESGPPTLTLEQAIEAITLLLAEFDKPDVKAKISEARATAGGVMEQVLLEVVPLMFEVQGHIMQKYGFTPGDDNGGPDGFADFAAALQQHEGNSDFAVLSLKLKALSKNACASGAEYAIQERAEAAAGGGAAETAASGGAVEAAAGGDAGETEAGATEEPQANGTAEAGAPTEDTKASAVAEDEQANGNADDTKAGATAEDTKAAAEPEATKVNEAAATDAVGETEEDETPEAKKRRTT